MLSQNAFTSPSMIFFSSSFVPRPCKRFYHLASSTTPLIPFLRGYTTSPSTSYPSSIPSKANNNNKYRLHIHSEVSTALTSPLIQLRKPVVALESTLFAHGMPYPQNLQLANELISIIRNKNVIPAIIAIKNGTCHVGLTQDEMEDLAMAGIQGRAQKISTRDLPLILAKNNTSSTRNKEDEQEQENMKLLSLVEKEQDKSSTISWGATTVASTMRLAHLAGIQTFVTGGIGGVHRGGQESMDISADLQELAKTPVVVVSAGIKSILDIRRTLELLETLSVPTVTYQSGEFPAFFSPQSGISTPARVDSVHEIARAYQASIELNLHSGILVAIPNQDPAGTRTENAIQEAIRDAEVLGIKGQEVTPFILKAVAIKTDGDSLKSNMALVKRNAYIGSDIAIAIFNQTHTGRYVSKSSSDSRAKSVVIMGGSVVDIMAKPDFNSSLIIGSSTPGSCHESFGGVGRNIAETLGRLGLQPVFYSAVGADHRGTAILKDLTDCGVLFEPGHSINVVEDATTSTFLAMIDAHGDLQAAIADMRVLENIPVPSREVLENAHFLVIDANCPYEKMLEAAKLANRIGVSVLFEPTSVPKAKAACRSQDFVSFLTFASPNVEELTAMAYIDENVPQQYDRADAHNSIFIRDAATIVLKRMMPRAYLLVTLGANGVLLASKMDDETPNDGRTHFTHFPAVEIAHHHVLNTTGGGDSLVGAFLKALIDGKDIAEAITYGQHIAVQSISYQKSAISPFIK